MLICKDGTFVVLHDSGKRTVLNLKASMINKYIKSLIEMLSQKGFSKFQSYLKELPDDGISENHIKIIKKLIENLALLCNNKYLDDKIVTEIIKFVELVTKSDNRENYTESYGDKQKKELLTATLELLSIQKFQNQIFTEKNRGFDIRIVDDEKKIYEPKSIGRYTNILVNISNSNLFKFLSPDNQNKFFGILKLLFEDGKISENIFNADNLGDQGPIRLYITALSNTAAEIRPLENINQDSKTKRNNRKKHNSMKNNHDEGKKVEIFNYNVRFLLKATKKIVTDKNLKMLVFDVEKNPLSTELFLKLQLNLGRHIQYLQKIRYGDDEKITCDQILFDILEILLGNEFSNCFTIQKSYMTLSYCLGEISCYANILNNDQKKKLSTMLSRTLLCEKWTQNILSDEKFVSNYFEYLTILFEKAKDLIEPKTLIASTYNCFEKSFVLQRMVGIENELYACLRILENVTKECKNIDGEDLALVYGNTVGILKNIQNGNYLFKEQIFQTVENQINEENINDDRRVLAFFGKHEKNPGNKKQIIRIYTSILKNISQLSSNKKINIKGKIKFFGVMNDILLKEDLKDIRAMIFNPNEQENEGAINNFMQAFSNLLSIDNLNNLNKNDKKFCIDSRVDFVCDKNLKNQICNLANNEKIKNNDIPKYKSVIIRFYTSMLKNISQLSNEENIDIKKKVKLFNLVQDILIKKDYADIKKMIFNETENGPQGAICNFIQVFYNLLSTKNLKQLDNDNKKSWIQLFLSFLSDEYKEDNIFHNGHAGEGGAIAFYLKTLCNILSLENASLTDENERAVANLIQNLDSKDLNVGQSLSQCKDAYYYHTQIQKRKEILGPKKTIKNKKQKKDLKTSNSMPDLLLPSQKLKIVNSKNKLTLLTKDSKQKKEFTNKPKDISESTKMLNASKSMINLLKSIKSIKMFSNKPNLNIGTFKPQGNPMNKKIKIAITGKKNLFDPQKKSEEKPNMIDKNEFDKPKDF